MTVSVFPRVRARRAAGLAAAVAVLLAGAPGARAGEQARRAVAAVQALRAQGAIPADAALRLVVKQGNINNYWGRDFELKREWEEQTGVTLDAEVMPQQPVLEVLRHRPDLDLTVARTQEYPDLVAEGLVADLTPYARKHGLDLEEGAGGAFLLPRLQTAHDGKVVAVPADFDVALLYLRRDLLEDPAHRQRFRARHGRDPAAPRTWAEYQDLVAFFHDPARGLYGTCEQRDPDSGWMFWMPRYLSQGFPVQPLFDDQMRPLLTTPAGIRATESYLATLPFSPPEILGKGNDYSFSLPVFRRGQAFSYLITPAGAKVLHTEGSPVREKFLVAPIPGSVVDGRLVRRTTLIFGNNLVVGARSPHPELAFLFALWFSDPDVSARSVAVASGFADPFRRSHLADERVRAIYSAQALEGLAAELPFTVAAGTGLPGDTEYLAALNHELWLAAKGELTARQAMERTAAEWERITDRRGRAAQARLWRSFRAGFPTAFEPAPPKPP
ncbi:MAG: ABC transporter substrate-binding protein [Deferrisomatales bacterium]